MASETHLTQRWYQARSVPWAGHIWLRRVIACPSSALQGNLSMLQCWHYQHRYRTTDFPRRLLFHGFVSNLCSAVVCFLCHWSYPASTPPPHCCALTSVLHAYKVTEETLECIPYPSARAQLRGMSFWDTQPQFWPSAAALPHPLKSPQHCYWRGLCKSMQPRAHFWINQSKLKLMNKKYRSRSSSKAILSLSPCVSPFLRKMVSFIYIWVFFWGGRMDFNFFKAISANRICCLSENPTEQR